jgi:PHP family Zn ribbon phosphoesterase
MQFIADFHIHSRYSRATSPNMDVENIAKYAKMKGISIVGTGDFTHPLWLKELKEKLRPLGNGLFDYDGTFFMLTSEVNNIFSKGGKIKQVHNILFAPSFEAVDQINEQLAKKGELESDGRPSLNMPASELVELIIGISKECAIVPAHAWTPWRSIFGSASGFNSVEECFEEQSKHIFALETGLSCYDKKTEVLTADGWKYFKEINYRDKICTLNPKTNEIEFQIPIKIHAYNYKGKMYRLKTKRADLLVTPNHQLFYSPCDFRKQPNFVLKEAQFLFNKSKRFKKDGMWKGKNVDYFTLPIVKIKHGSRYYSGFRNEKEKQLPIKSWLKFFGFWIAEGWTTEGKNGDYNVCLSNKDNALISEMRGILQSFGYTTYWSKKAYTLRVRDYQLFHYLKQFGKCYDKFIPREVKSLSKELLEIFFEYYIKGDGHIYGRNRKGLSATTTSVHLRDDLQEIALKMGMSAYYKLGQKKGTPLRSLARNKRIYKQNEDTWVIYFIRKNIHTVLPSTIKKYKYVESWVDFEGPVFCVTVPNHVIYIRRNGIPLWCGNSDPKMNWMLSSLDKFTLISNSDSHSPAKIGREANVFSLENPTYSSILEAIRKKDKSKFKLTIEFFPEEGKYHYDGHRICNVRLSPVESIKNNNICPVCKRKLTIGVMHRVTELADRKYCYTPSDAIPFVHAIPLEELIASVRRKGVGSASVQSEYSSLVSSFGTEINILLNAEPDELKRKAPEDIANAIIRVREGKVKILPGYDGVYGEIKPMDTESGQSNLSKFL